MRVIMTMLVSILLFARPAVSMENMDWLTDDETGTDAVEINYVMMGDSHAMKENHGGMRGLLGNYPLSRDASGTAWQPDSSPMEGSMPETFRDFKYMYHVSASVIYDVQSGPRADRKTFISNMVMLMGQRPTRKGMFSFRGMLSLEPWTIGDRGYPEVLQTGETADGKTPLIDRQHPHDLFMELAAMYTEPVDEDTMMFVYGGLPGEPALGPAAYMHRFSGMYIPDAPLTHHWLDSTHITFGVFTTGFVRRNMKMEASLFRGREPGENRWNLESPKLDSYSARFSMNPAQDWAFQVSYGRLESPEQLDPDNDIGRTTLSATYNKQYGPDNWQSTFAWGRNVSHGNNLDGFLLESTYNLEKRHLFFGRWESVRKDELFAPPSPLADDIYLVGKFEMGYEYFIPVQEHIEWGVGASGAIHFVPRTLTFAYDDELPSYFLFTGIRLH